MDHSPHLGEKGRDGLQEEGGLDGRRGEKAGHEWGEFTLHFCCYTVMQMVFGNIDLAKY